MKIETTVENEKVEHKILEMMMDMRTDVIKEIKGNKAAGQRARVYSIKLQNLFKIYRFQTMKKVKK